MTYINEWLKISNLIISYINKCIQNTSSDVVYVCLGDGPDNVIRQVLRLLVELRDTGQVESPPSIGHGPLCLPVVFPDQVSCSFCMSLQCCQNILYLNYYTLFWQSLILKVFSLNIWYMSAVYQPISISKKFCSRLWCSHKQCTHIIF